MKLDIGAGQNKKEGFKGMDLWKGSDIVHDLTVFPWPIKSGSVEEAHCSHVFEHIPGKLRGLFMDEVYRILKPGAKITVIVPAYNNARSVQDFTHEWPPLAPPSFFYFQKPFREGNKLTHGFYDLKCDFDLIVSGTIGEPWTQKSMETQMYNGTHLWNVTQDIVAIMTKKAPEVVENLTPRGPVAKRKKKR
jgi:hypothetical protein